MKKNKTIVIQIIVILILIVWALADRVKLMKCQTHSDDKKAE